MTEQIKTAKVWGHRSSPSALLHHAGRKSDNFNVPYLIVSGLSDPEAAALPEIMERERGVCEWEGGYLFTDCRHLLHGAVFEFCPSCGRKVVVK